MFPNISFVCYLAIAAVIFFASNNFTAFSVGEFVGISIIPIISIVAYNLRPASKRIRNIAIFITTIWLILTVGAFFYDNQSKQRANNAKLDALLNVNYKGVILYFGKNRACLTTQENKFSFTDGNGLTINGKFDVYTIHISLSNGASGVGTVTDNAYFSVITSDGHKIEGKAFDDLAFLYAEDGVEPFNSEAKSCRWIK